MKNSIEESLLLREEGITNLITGSSDKGTPKLDGQQVNRREWSEERGLFSILEKSLLFMTHISLIQGSQSWIINDLTPAVVFLPDHLSVSKNAWTLPCRNHGRDTKRTNNMERNCCPEEDGASSF